MNSIFTRLAQGCSSVVTLSLLTACSVWQNAPRKYLEKSSYDFTGLKLHEHLIACAAPNTDTSWTEASRDDDARTFTRTDAAAYELRVEPAHARGDFACDYTFATDEERTTSAPAAVQHALSVTP